MSESDTLNPSRIEPTQLELDTPDLYSQFLLHSRTEILFVLRSLIQKTAMMTVYFDQGRSFLLTSLLAVSEDGNSLLFDYGSDEEMNQKTAFADRFIFTTTLERVKIQFRLGNLRRTSFQGRPAFIGDFPDSMLRLQRREYFRLSIPVATPVRCTMAMPLEDGTTFRLTAPLLDISGGGIGLMVPTEQRTFMRPDNLYEDARIQLPEEGLITATLCVRSVFDVEARSGARYLRVGLEFVDLPGTRLTLIQRYITRIERERKARISGMG